MNCLSLHCFVEVRCNFVTLFQRIAVYRRRPGILAESVTQMPIARDGESGSPAGSLPETMVPDPRRTYEIGVFSQRSCRQLRFSKRNESATLVNYFTDAIKKKGRTLHHAPTQDDHIRHKEIDQIGQTETQVVSFPLDRPAGQLITLLRKLADLFCGEICAIAAVRWYIHFEPRSHGWTSRQRFPTPSEPAGARRSGWVDNVVTNLGMGHIRAAVQLSIQYDSAADTRADRHIDQSRLA